ncbi:hypothetical protein [Huintestinicola sp.]|uniref:beta-xylosidase family glycoside hydrolase n=1 Tax=Huintestinicola sp. TaxID=2981661 RepID=UPI003D7C8727
MKGVYRCFLRHPHRSDYDFSGDGIVLHGTDITLDDVDSPTFVGIRQRDFDMELTADICVSAGEGGVTVYSCENEHYDIAVRKSDGGFEAVLRLNIGGIKHIQNTVPLNSGKARLIIRSDSMFYNFYVSGNGDEIHLGCGQSKYLSSEVSGGFTGVVLGLYAVGGQAEFSDFDIKYED